MSELTAPDQVRVHLVNRALDRAFVVASTVQARLEGITIDVGVLGLASDWATTLPTITFVVEKDGEEGNGELVEVTVFSTADTMHRRLKAAVAKVKGDLAG
jgi:hypothetical protein